MFRTEEDRQAVIASLERWLPEIAADARRAVERRRFAAWFSSLFGFPPW